MKSERLSNKTGFIRIGSKRNRKKAISLVQGDGFYHYNLRCYKVI